MTTTKFSAARRLIQLLFLAAIAVIGAGCGKMEGSAAKSPVPDAPTAQATPAEHHGQASVVDPTSDPNALQVAMSAEDFSTLVVAVKAAGVEDSLVNTGPLTVFAPQNSAFEKLPAGTVETLLKPENKAKLSFILINHVAPANYPEAQLKKESAKKRKLYMASGQYLTVEEKPDGIYVGGTKILKTIKVSNGWIHVVDDVLVPSEESSKDTEK